MLQGFLTRTLAGSSGGRVFQKTRPPLFCTPPAYESTGTSAMRVRKYHPLLER